MTDISFSAKKKKKKHSEKFDSLSCATIGASFNNLSFFYRVFFIHFFMYCLKFHGMIAGKCVEDLNVAPSLNFIF